VWNLAERPLRLAALATAGLGVVLALGVRAQLLGMPLERDEGIYLYFGQLVLDGAVPYLDFYELKPPLLYYAYAAIHAIAGIGVERAHAAFALINLATAGLIGAAATRLYDGFAGAVAASGFLLLSLGRYVCGFTAQAEHLVALLAAAGLLFVVRARDGGRGSVVLAGVFFACAALVKQSGVAFVLFGLVALAGPAGARHGWAAAVRTAALFAGGCVAVVAPVLAWVAASGAFAEFLYWTVEFSRSYVTTVPWSAGMSTLAALFPRIVSHYELLWIAAAAGLVASWVWDRDRARVGLLCAFAICGFATVWPGLRFYWHYWLQLLPAIALALAAGAHLLHRALLPRIGAARSALTCAALAWTAIGAVAWLERDYFVSPDPVRVMRQVYAANPFPEALELGREIGKRTQPGDTIALIGSEPQIYYYANRRAASKHAYFSFLVAPGDRSREMQREFIADVEARPPAVIVAFRHPTSLFVHPGADTAIFEWARGFLAQNYRRIGVADQLGPLDTHYAWDDAAREYDLESPFAAVVFERISR